MDRRGFLGAMIGGISLAAARSWPFRVYSFPSKVSRWEGWDVGTSPSYIQSVWLTPGGLFLDGDKNVLIRNTGNEPIVVHTDMFVKGIWECKDGIVMKRGDVCLS